MNNSKKYKSINGNIITVSDKFTYELSKYRLYKNRAEYISGYFVNKDSFINDIEQIKYTDSDYIEVLSLILVSAPLNFILNRGLHEVA